MRRSREFLSHGWSQSRLKMSFQPWSLLVERSEANIDADPKNVGPG
jgi:hypothetical protein